MSRRPVSRPRAVWIKRRHRVPTLDDSHAQVMPLLFCFYWIAFGFSIALGNPSPDDPPPYSDFLSEDSNILGGFNPSDSLSLDSWVPAADSPDAALTLLENDSLVDSAATSLELADFSDTFADPLDPLRVSSCTTLDGDLPSNSKRDNEICVPQAPVQSLPDLHLPDLMDVEGALGSSQSESPKSRVDRIDVIPGYTHVGDDFSLCPGLHRRLCCLGPLGSKMDNLHRIVKYCRGSIKTSSSFPSFHLFSPNPAINALEWGPRC